MRTLLLLLLALLLGALPASAKLTFGSPVPLTAAVLPAALAPVPTDTAAALHHLFERKRKLRRRMVLGTTGAGVLLAGVGVADAGNQHDGLAKGLDYGFAFLCGCVAALAVLVFLVVYDRYSRLHERRALNWLRYHTLPADLVRELEPQDFEASSAP